MDSAIRRQTIADLLRRTAGRLPNKPGLICGTTHWTFAEFDAVVDRVAAGLAGRGVGQGSRVAVLARRRRSNSKPPPSGITTSEITRSTLRDCSTPNASPTPRVATSS